MRRLVQLPFLFRVVAGLELVYASVAISQSPVTPSPVTPVAPGMLPSARHVRREWRRRSPDSSSTAM